MKRLVFAALSGALFGAGLVISELSNPVKVLNFLDIAGAWDPSLIIVMGVGAGVTALGYRLVWRRAKPLCGSAFQNPTNTVIDRPLMLRAVLFGLGWGLTGYCPGPAITTLVISPSEGLWCVAAMIAGLTGLNYRLRELLSVRKAPLSDAMARHLAADVVA